MLYSQLDNISLQSGSNATRFALDKDDEKNYNNEKGIVDEGDQNSESNKTIQTQENGGRDDGVDGSRWRDISISNDDGTVSKLSQIIKNQKTIEKISGFFTEIYTNSI